VRGAQSSRCKRYETLLGTAELRLERVVSMPMADKLVEAVPV
jgi:hypothetical protein